MKDNGLRNNMLIKGKGYQLKLEYDDHMLWIDSGCFGKMSIAKSTLFYAKLKNVENGTFLEISSDITWEKVSINQIGHTVKSYFINPQGISELTVAVKGVYDDTGISWSVEVFNDNSVWSVMEITYQIPFC